jgi:hypothetical protein
MAGRAIPLRAVNAATINVNTCSARELLDYARTTLNVQSLYALGIALDLSPQYPQRWYKLNNLPRTARTLIILRTKKA